MAKTREEINIEDKWNTSALFINDALWKENFEKLKKEISIINTFKGQLKTSSATIKKLFETQTDLERKLDKLYTYAHMRHDEDIKNETYKTQFDLSYNLSVEYSELTSFIVPELINIPDGLMEKFINSNDLKEYKFYLEKILRAKKHTLTEKEELLLSMASNAMTASYDGFNSLTDADIKFNEITDDKNNKMELTHSLYQVYLHNKNRTIRENAFKSYHNKFNEYPTTITSLLYGKIKEHVFYARARGFKNSLDASLFYKNIDETVYYNLINTVKNRIGSLHNYIKYRKEKMKLKELHLYDMYVPFVDSVEIKIEYKQAVNLLLESIKILGDEYTEVLKKGLITDNWVDKYENLNKRSGAYSTGCYDSMPYILMNYNGMLNSARTLAHEAGHSMHSYFTNKNQNYIYSGYPIFLAEVASTFNEELFNNLLIKKAKDKKETMYLINSRLEEIRATLFRQTMFAEFELLIHNLVENNVPLTYQLLNKEYKKLNQFYFGDEVVIDDEIEIEWARIPHFYYNYYVYQYATGISAAIALFKKVYNGNEKDKNDYLNFLKAGNSKYPIDILKEAGVDMTTNAPVNNAINYFDELLKQLSDLDK